MTVTDRRVTVVVASRNRRDQVLATVARHLELPERPHVIVVDDASTDGTADALRGVEVIRRRASAGGAARNDGVRAARTPYVALTDDDAWWEPGALSRAADLLDRHPGLAVLQPHVLVGPDERDDPTCTLMRQSPLAAVAGQPGHPILSFVACSVVVRRDAYLSEGSLSARLGVGGEEELLSIDLAARGWGLAYVEEVVAHHHPSPSRDPSGRRRVQVRNALWSAWLRRPLDGAARQTAHLAALALHQPGARSGILLALLGLPWVLRERHPVHPELEAALRTLAH
jgi:N-acetylglucosaminyl-diphospho-decaprenol L-rhamnosyltransferase